MTCTTSLLSYGITFLFLVSVAYLFNFLKRNHGPLPWNWPLLGMLPTLFVSVSKIHDTISDILLKNDATFVFKGPWFTNSDTLFTCDPDNVDHVLSTSFSDYDKGQAMKHVFEVFGDQGLFTLNLEEWKPLRTTMRKLFADQRFTWTAGKLVRQGLEKRLISLLDNASRKQESVDFQDLTRVIMFDSSCALLSGYDSLALNNSGIHMGLFSRALDDANEIIIGRLIFPKIMWKTLKWLKIGGEKKVDTARKTIDEVAEKIIKKKLEDGVNNQGFDMLNFLMHDDVVCKDYNFMKDAFVGLMFAAGDTTSISLTWFFWLLSENPSVEPKIRHELVSRLPQNESQKFKIFTIEELSKLPYLHAALSETLRLYPPGPLLQRVPLQANTLPSGHRVKPNMSIILSFYATGRMASVWGKDCLEFKPERWISEEGHFKYELSNKFLSAFSDGPRICPGKDAALMSMKVYAANIIHNYNIHVKEKKPATFLPAILLAKKDGLKVQVTKRWP